MRSNALNRVRGPRLGRMALVPIVAAAVFVLLGLLSQQVTEGRRVAAVEAAVLASGRTGPVEVEPLQGGCWRSREGFAWRTPSEAGFACAGPGDEVTLLKTPPRGVEGL